MTIQDLHSDEFNPYYNTYISKVGAQSLKEGLKESGQKTYDFLNSISVEKYNYSYAEGKWTIKELIQHIIDVERVFTYRALRIARQDKTPLAGFDENDYAPNSNANRRTKEELLEDYKTLRNSTVALFNSFTEEMLLSKGIASDSPLSVRAAGFITIGHEIHHCNIIKERYL